MKNVRFILSAMMAVVLFCVCAAPAFAEDSAEVRVTVISDGIQLAQKLISVTDADGDGRLTINDALYAAHEASFEGGAEAGYSSVESEFGMSLVRLWGTENGGSYGYCVNNSSSQSLLDPIADGDQITAYAFSDLVSWTDRYSFFDRYTVAAVKGEELFITLYMIDYDEDWNEVTIPLSGAEITINGQPTGIITGDGGMAQLILSTEGTLVISALSDQVTLVPPVCVAEVVNRSLGDTILNYGLVILLLSIPLVAIAVFNRKGRNKSAGQDKK